MTDTGAAMYYLKQPTEFNSRGVATRKKKQINVNFCVQWLNFSTR